MTQPKDDIKQIIIVITFTNCILPDYTPIKIGLVTSNKKSNFQSQDQAYCNQNII